jgi:hypothetical protein
MLIVSGEPNSSGWRPDPREITGTHDFVIIKKEHDEMVAAQKAEEDRKRDSGIWWHRQKWLWGMATVIVVFASLAGACVTYAVSHFK